MPVRRTMLLLLLVWLWSVIACRTAAPLHASPEPTPPTPRLFIGLGVPSSVVLCVQVDPNRWSCSTIGELRAFLATVERL